MSYQLKLWDSKRERKLTGLNTLPAVRRTKGLSKSREELAGCRPAKPPGGRKQGGGERGRLCPKDHIPYHTANRPPVSNQRLPEILDGRHPTSAVARHRAHALDWRGRKLRLGPRRGKGAPHPGRVRPSSSWLPEPLGWGRHKTQAQPSLRFCETLEGWNLAQRRARSIENRLESGPLWSTRKPELEQPGPGKCTQLRACSLYRSREPKP